MRSPRVCCDVVARGTWLSQPRSLVMHEYPLFWISMQLRNHAKDIVSQRLGQAARCSRVRLRRLTRERMRHQARCVTRRPQAACSPLRVLGRRSITGNDQPGPPWWSALHDTVLTEQPRSCARQARQRTQLPRWRWCRSQRAPPARATALDPAATHAARSAQGGDPRGTAGRDAEPLPEHTTYDAFPWTPRRVSMATRSVGKTCACVDLRSWTDHHP